MTVSFLFPVRCSFVEVAQVRIIEETTSFVKKASNSGRESTFSWVMESLYSFAKNYKFATVHSKCAFTSKQSVYMQDEDEIHVYVIFFLINKWVLRKIEVLREK